MSTLVYTVDSLKVRKIEQEKKKEKEKKKKEDPKGPLTHKPFLDMLRKK